MAVDFAIKRFYGCKVAAIKYKGGWKGEGPLREAFNEIKTWAKEKGVKTGRWFFMEFGELDTPNSERGWEAAIEIKSKARSKGRIKQRTLSPTAVAVVKFDPNKVSPRLVYHGLESWLSWQEKGKKYKQTGVWREVYLGDPWTNARAWANTEVQATVKKLS